MLRQEIISISKLKYVLNHLIKIKENCYKMIEHTKTKELYYKIEPSSFIFTFSNYMTCLNESIYIYTYIQSSLGDTHQFHIPAYTELHNIIHSNVELNISNCVVILTKECTQICGCNNNPWELNLGVFIYQQICSNNIFLLWNQGLFGFLFIENKSHIGLNKNAQQIIGVLCR